MNGAFFVLFLAMLLFIVLFVWVVNHTFKTLVFWWKTSDVRKQWATWQREHAHQIGKVKRIFRSWGYRVWPQRVYHHR